MTHAPDTDITVIRWQYCKDGMDIGGNLYAEDDADTIRAWEGAHGDFCLLEVTRIQTPTGGRTNRWKPSGGDGTWTDLLKPSGNRTYPSPQDALTQLVGVWREATEADEDDDSSDYCEDCEPDGYDRNGALGADGMVYSDADPGL